MQLSANLPACMHTCYMWCHARQACTGCPLILQALLPACLKWMYLAPSFTPTHCSTSHSRAPAHSVVDMAAKGKDGGQLKVEMRRTQASSCLLMGHGACC